MKQRQSDNRRAANEVRATEALKETQESLDHIYRDLETRVAGIEASNTTTQSASSGEIIGAIRERMFIIWRMTRESDPPQLDYVRELERLYALWRRSVTAPDEVIDYCEDRLQWLESRLAALGGDDGPLSTRSAFGPDIEAEIAALKGEVRKQERVLSRRHH